ncbi:hypothetical protein [Saccharibacillus alkalitolerans]|uniref:Uncharacterized protein n=1 Tax=Saccharibacillus alkalitolerans TaxID=2705290 RepID=A0ABX0F9C3_9BACL|nr:hypothetical protein [Saccharibacillus alkalitolerans]NGZ76918.1 hypothetical protein [Saccharibacillus alkalitolerans]
MGTVKKVFYFIAVFLVVFIVAQVIVKVVITSAISDDYLKSLITLLLSVGIALFAAIKITGRSARKKL